MEREDGRMTEETRWCSCNPLREAREKAAKWDAIVRCGECVHYRDHEIFPYEDFPDLCVRTPYGMKVDPDSFCSWGERRANDAEC